MNRPVPRLIAITDGTVLGGSELLARLGKLARSARPGSVAVLLREHAASARQRLALGQRLRDLTRAAQQQLWVADRLDLALLLGADGVHLGEGSVSARTARALLGDEMLVSRAWHQAVAAPAPELDGVDALLVSPVFAPRKGRPALGAGALGALARALSEGNVRPALYALGGVTAADIPVCDAAGAAGIAAIGAVLVDDPTALVAALGIGAV